MAFNGVRSSWDIAARNPVFARFAASDSARRRASSTSRCCAMRRSVRSRVTLANPTNDRSSAYSAVMTTLAQNWVPSLRTRHPSSSNRPTSRATLSS
jgi:hypothetical protein